MTHLFYALVAVCLIYELFKYTNSAVVFEIVEKCKEASKTGDKETAELYAKKIAGRLLFEFFYMIICIIGLFSSQWCLFACIIALSMIPKRKLISYRADCIVSILILIAIIVCKYHF